VTQIPEIPDEIEHVLDDLAEFIHTCDDTEERAEVCRRLILVVHALTPITRLSGVEHPSLRVTTFEEDL